MRNYTEISEMMNPVAMNEIGRARRQDMMRQAEAARQAKQVKREAKDAPVAFGRKVGSFFGSAERAIGVRGARSAEA